MSARAVVVLVLLAPALAGCTAPAPAAVVDGFDPAVPHCVGACARIVDDSPSTPLAPFLAVDPTDPDHIVVSYSMRGSADPADTSDLRSGVALTRDGGATWEVHAVPGGPAAGATHPLGQYQTTGYHSSTVFLPDGTVVMSAGATNDYYAGNVQVSPGDTVYTMRSKDGGVTWGDVRFVGRGEGVSAPGVSAGLRFNYQARLAVGADGGLLLVWTQFTSGHPDDGLSQDRDVRLVFASSDDGGLTWSTVGTVDDEGYGWNAQPIIGRDGVWRVAFTNRENAELRFAETRDRGETWAVRTLAETLGWPSMRAQTLSSGVERLLLAYTTPERVVVSEHRTLLTWSDDGGASWESPVLVDRPEGPGRPRPQVAGASGDDAWVTFFDYAPGSGGVRARYVAVRVVDGVVGAPLVLDDLERGGPGEYLGLVAAPNGDALAAWTTFGTSDYDIAWARVTGGERPVPRPVADVDVPAGLDAPLAYEFTGRLNLPYYCLDPDATVEQAVREQASATFSFEVPPDTRFVNGSLSWETMGATPETSDLDVRLYDPDGDYFNTPNGVPETFSFEIRDSERGTWTAIVQNCQNPPTDFTLDLVLE